jgi:hypothetical protein
MSHRRLAAIVAGVLLLGVAGVGCTAVSEPSETPSASAEVIETPSLSASRTPEPSSTAQTEVSERQKEYEAAIAAWPEPLPPGYSWPTWTDLPHLEPHGVGHFRQADNASGIYRCILIDAAWHAYFEANDPVASKDYAMRADQYAIPDNPATLRVTEDGAIIDSDLPIASNICRGIAGELQH